MEDIQLTLFGRMFPERSVPTAVRISGEYSKPSQRAKFQCLIMENGQKAEWCGYQTVKSLGELLTPNIGEYPNAENVSTLSQVLEQNVPQKYYLSPKACLGILRRAETRGKETATAACKRTESAGFIGEASQNSGDIGYEVETAPTLRAGILPNCLTGAFEMSHADEVLRKCEGNVSPTLNARMGTGGNQIPLVFDVAYCIGNGQVDGTGFNMQWAARKYTPTECERLQGFPDNWTKCGADGKEISDTARYKALGNSIAIPCALRVIGYIADYDKKKAST